MHLFSDFALADNIITPDMIYTFKQGISQGVSSVVNQGAFAPTVNYHVALNITVSGSNALFNTTSGAMIASSISSVATTGLFT